uniref:AAA+ ATPase domain-containing protein n=1 Tax=Cannabis sativa TaxID=3483 RepID=A0A803QAG9_CANSA
MEFVISIGAKIAEYTVAPLGRQLGYLFRYTTNVTELRTQLEDLNNATQRMKRRIIEALNNCHEIEADVQTWQKNAEQISGEATTFLNPESHAKALCSCGSPHHLVTRHQLSRKANKMSINVRALLSKNKEFDSIPISYPQQPEGSSATPAKGYESFDSRSKILKIIMAAVGDAANRRSNSNRIGLYGMGGIGKTMLAKEIARLAEEEKLFSKVVMTTVSQTPNIKEIQQHIAEKLGLKLDEKDSTGKRAELLRMRMKQDESKILLILDDIWNELDLEAIGIHEECRMVITSRDQQVLRNFMGVAESNVFLIGALESSEAINLFMKIIGDTKIDYINDLALEIVNECGGLPIAIATVAHALKYRKEEAIWKDALRRLKSSNVEKKVYSSIKLSYDFLGSHEEEAKPLLLLCALLKIIIKSRIC